MNRALQFLHVALLTSASVASVAIAWLCFETIRAERTITASVTALPGIVDDRLKSIQNYGLGVLDAHLVTLESTLDAAVKTADARLASIETKMDSRLAAIQSDATAQLTTANQSIAAVSKATATSLPALTASLSKSAESVASDVHQVAQPVAEVAGQMNDAAPLFLDCDQNEDCAFNRFQGISKSAEQTLQAVAKSAPDIAQSAAKIEGHVDHITASIEKEADALTKPKRWWQKVIAYSELGALTAAKILF